jgi:hypothetical protein
LHSFDPSLVDGAFLPLKIGAGVLLGLILADFIHWLFDDDMPDGFV